MINVLMRRGTPAGYSPTADGRYLHWDELRHRTPPEGLSLEEWWFRLKMSRSAGATMVPLTDKTGVPFRFVPVDELQRIQHKIDQDAAGLIGISHPVLMNSETKKTYLMRSLLDEAFTSSQIEGAATTRDAAKAIIREGRRPRDRGERMVLNNYRTMERILELREECLTKEIVFELQRIVTDGAIDDPSAAGRIRKPNETVVVGDPVDGDVVYHIPPDALELEGRLERMCAFANGDTPDRFVHPAVRAMILHFWLAYDHPFVDGNGRTARALFYWAMLRSGYWLFEYVSISTIILRSPAKYERAFLYTETDDNDLTYFLLYHADVAMQAIRSLHEYIEQRTAALQKVAEELPGDEDLNHRQRALILHDLRHPGFRYSVESHRASHGVVTQTARTDLESLVARGLLLRKKSGRAFVYVPVTDLEQRLRKA